MCCGLTPSDNMELAVVRIVWKIEPVRSVTDVGLVAAIAPNPQYYIQGDFT